MLPILYENAWIVIPAWHFMYMLAGIVGFCVFRKLLVLLPTAGSEALHGRVVAGATPLFCIIYVAGYLGARAFSLMVEHGFGILDPGLWSGLMRLGSMTLYGGILGSSAAAVFYLSVKRLPARCYVDAAVVAGLVAIALGRLGCFLNGDDYGKPVSLQGEAAPWWSVAFPNHDEIVHRYPTQLMEAGACILIAWLCWILLRHGRRSGLRPRPGRCAAAGAGLYMLQRFFLEFLRGDERGRLGPSDLTPSQWVSAVGLLVLVLWVLRARTSRAAR